MTILRGKDKNPQLAGANLMPNVLSLQFQFFGSLLREDQAVAPTVFVADKQRVYRAVRRFEKQLRQAGFRPPEMAFLLQRLFAPRRPVIVPQIADVRPSRNWPASSQWRLFYNIPATDWRKPAGRIWSTISNTEPFSFFASVPYPPGIDYGAPPIDDAQESVQSYLESVNYPLMNERGNCDFGDRMFKYRYDVMGVIGEVDRTLETPLMNEKMFTVGYIKHFQSTVLAEHPLWRLHVCENNHSTETGLMIYPQVVCVGEIQCPPHDLESALSDWRESIAKIRGTDVAAPQSL